ncbi:MAG: hypothetical protein JNM22_04590 [Saprospiraceae bacterium]|nr:hypothetical protein [Saprospiraceae bacterium]
MLTLLSFKKLLGTSLFVSCSFLAQAVVLPYKAQINTLSPANPVTIGLPTATATVAVTQPWTGAFVDAAVSDRITLGIDHENMAFITLAGEIKVKIKLEIWLPNNTTTSPSSTNFIPEMVLNYQPFSNTVPYVDKSVYTFTKAYKYRITIDGITQNGMAISTLPANIFIDADIDVERYYDFSTNAFTPITYPASPNNTLDLNCDGIFDELVIQWLPMVGAEEYHLEWTFVNDYGATLNAPKIPAANLIFDFKNNSTRITTTATSYNLTLTFEHGYLLYRVRGVGRKLTDLKQSIVGVWNVADVGNAGALAGRYYNTQEHEGKKNWQYSATYAEEAKKKEVISYFDGSLRNRQSITKVNSDKNTIVGQTIYDYQGRPAVTIMPVPVNDPTCTSETPLKYYPNFNRDDSTGLHAYSRDDFDHDAADPCNAIAGPMSTASGASNYYSPANPEKNGAQAFVPDGEKYPFTQIEYTPDNTGRVKSQGGVGLAYQLGQHHETRYFYGFPNQIQLDRLFGSEVGDAAHYKKNVVVDANGQASVSYLDQEGRTIATALAGDAPKDTNDVTILAPLDSESKAKKTLTIDLFAKNALGVSSLNTVNVPGNAVVFNSQLLVSYESEYEFRYDLNIGQLTDSCLKVKDICFSCVYDLEIKVTDDCGQLVTPMTGNQPVNKTVGHFTADASGNVASFNRDCTGTAPFTHSESFKLNLPIGNYTVSKILTVNTAARDFYVATYLDTTYNTCVKSLADFQLAAFAKIDTADCNITCKTCDSTLRTVNGIYYPNVKDARDAYVAAGTGTELEFDYLLKECGAPCKTVTWCEVTYQQMLLDVSPDGQYAEFQPTIAGKAPDLTLSVLHIGNSLPKSFDGIPTNWQNPSININGQNYDQYLEVDGKRSIVPVQWNGSGWIPALRSSAIIKQSPAGVTYVYPQELRDVVDFVANWKENWAKSLVQYHPEYCYYESCAKYNVVQPGDALSSDAFDSIMLVTNTYAAAFAAKLVASSYPPGGLATTMARFVISTNPIFDPFLNSVTYAGYGTQLMNAFNAYQNLGSIYSMVEVAAITARCGTLYGTQPSAPGCTDFGKITGPDPIQVLDQEWNLLKNFYLSEKRKIQQQLADNTARAAACHTYNGCIGDSTYNPHASGMINYGGTINNFFSSPYFKSENPCSMQAYPFYLKKQKRFVGPNDIHALGPEESDYQMYLKTGQCPLAVDLQYLIAALAAKDQLDNPAGEPLQPYGEFTGDLYTAVSGGIMPAGYIPYAWKATTVSGNILNGNFVNTLTNTSICGFTLDKTGTSIAAWDDIDNIVRFKYTGTVGANYEFEVVTAIKLVSGAYVYETLHGSTCLKITGCTFQGQGTANQLAKDLSALMSALQANNHLKSTSAIDFAQPQFQQYQLFVTQAIKNVLGTTSTALIWVFTGTQYELYNISSKKLVIKFASFAPGSFQNGNLFPQIVGFKDIKSKYQNFFEFSGINAGNATKVIINGSVELVENSVSTGVSMGSVGLPAPLDCQGVEYKLREDLEKLLYSALLKRPFNGNIDLTQNGNYTGLLQSYLPQGLTHTGSVYTYTESGGYYTDTLTFTIYSEQDTCKMRLNHRAKLPPHRFQHLIGFDGPLTPYGAVAADNNYYTFYIIGIYKLGASTFQDTIWGESCLPLKICHPCPEDAKPDCGVCDSIRVFPPTSLCKNEPAVFRLETAGCAGTGGVAWNYGDGTVSSLATHTYKDTGTYTVTLTNIVKPGCPRILLLLAEMTVVVNDCGKPGMPNRNPNISKRPDSLTGVDEKLMEQCSLLYAQYVSTYRKFENRKQVSQLCKDYKNTSPFYSYDQFINNGLCSNEKALKLFINYIDAFNSVPPCPGAMPNPDSINPGNIKECERLYAIYIRTIDQYNSSVYVLSHNTTLVPVPGSYKLFIEAGFCDCVSAYVKYLEPYLIEPKDSTLGLPVNIDKFPGCTKPQTGDPCKDAYRRYLEAVAAYNAYVDQHPKLELPKIKTNYQESDFTVTGFCYCVDGYVALLQAIINGTITLKGSKKELLLQLDIASKCPGNLKPPCDPPLPQPTFVSPHYTPHTNPCVQYQIDLAYLNAANAYQQYVDSLTTWIAAAYNAHCLQAFESFTAKYEDKEYHFTLYYYDQAGNLIKTVPPEGVALVNISKPTDPAALQINSDRTFKRHTYFTDHTMATTYVYNSLNQLVRQNMPDHDPMDIWEYTLPSGLDPRLKVTATQFVTATKGYLSGNIDVGAGASAYKRGYLYTTDDGGQSWTKVNDLVASDLKKVQMVDAQIGFAVGSDGIFLRTVDGGATWDMRQQRYEQDAADINDLYFTSPTNGIIVGDSGLLMITKNAGLTFTNAMLNFPQPTNYNFSSITFDGTNFYLSKNNLAGTEGEIWKSSNINAIFTFTWTLQSSIRSTDLQKIQLVAGTSGYAIGIDGTLLKTTNTGSKWTTIATGLSANFRDVYFKDMDKGVAIIDSIPGYGLIYKTTDGGQSWSLLSKHDGIYFNSFHFYSVDKGYALGQKGVMKRVVLSGNFGLVNIPGLPVSFNISAAFFSDGDKGWVVGNSATIYYTTNGTANFPTWTPVNTGLTGVDFKKVYFGAIGAVGQNAGLLLGTNEKVYKITPITPTGTNYTFPKISDDVVDIDDSNAKVFLYDKALGQLKSIDKTNFASAPLVLIGNSGSIPPKLNVRSICAKNGNDVFTAGLNGDIYQANNANTSTVNWTELSKKVLPLAINDLQAAGVKAIYAVGSEGSFLQCTNGTDWKTLPTGTVTNLNAIKFNTANTAAIPGTLGLIAGNDGLLYKQSISGAGANLTKITLATNSNLYDIALNISNKAYVSGANGTIVSIPDIALSAPLPSIAALQPAESFRGLAYKIGTNQVYAVGDRAAVYSYNNTGGAKIKAVFTPGLNDVNFLNAFNGYIVGGNDIIRHTADGGQTWKYVKPITSANIAGSTPVLNGVWTTQPDKAIIIGNAGYVGRIGGVDGTTLNYYNIGSGSNLFDVAVKADTGYIVGQSGIVFKTTNNGNTFATMTPIPSTSTFRAIHIFQDKTVIAVGSKKKIYYFNGTNWLPHSVPSSPAIPALVFTDVFFHDDRTGYVVGSGGPGVGSYVLRSTFTKNIQQSGANAAGWVIKLLTGTNGVTSPATVDLVTIDFATRYRGFLGGSFNTGTSVNYTRLVTDESELFSTRFTYDKLGRLVLSQNTKQYNRKNLPTQLDRSDYSYTRYDELGRIKEVGEISDNTTASNFSSIFGTSINGQYNPQVVDDAKLNAFLNAGVRREVTKTYYDFTVITGLPIIQENLRKRVASVSYEDVDDNNDQTYQHATHYSYDIHGNVKTLLQDNPSLEGIK